VRVGVPVVGTGASCDAPHGRPKLWGHADGRKNTALVAVRPPTIQDANLGR